MAGAFGAHGLRELVTPQRLDVWNVATDYQMAHGLGLLLLSLTRPSLDSPKSGWLQWSLWALLTGILIFSSSLYLLVWLDIAWLGAITPIGGSLLVVGWGLAAVSFWPRLQR